MLDRILHHTSLTVRPFALCELRGGARCDMASKDGEAQLAVVLAGRGQLVTAAGSTKLVPYATVLVPPRTTYAFQGARSGAALIGEALAATDAGLRRVVRGAGEHGIGLACGTIALDEPPAAGLFERLPAPIVADFASDPLMRALLDALLDEQRTEAPGRDSMVESILRICVIRLLRQEMREATPVPWLVAMDDPRLRDALDRILKDPAAPHSLDGLAAASGMSRSSFSQHFLRKVGQSPMAFVRVTRLRLAARLLLSSELPIKLVASRAGFASRAHFSRAFKEQFGVEPGRYRG